MADLMDRSNGSILLNVCFNRLVQDWKLDSIADFLSLMYALNFGNDVEDRMMTDVYFRWGMQGSPQNCFLWLGCIP